MLWTFRNSPLWKVFFSSEHCLFLSSLYELLEAAFTNTCLCMYQIGLMNGFMPGHIGCFAWNGSLLSSLSSFFAPYFFSPPNCAIYVSTCGLSIIPPQGGDSISQGSHGEMPPPATCRPLSLSPLVPECSVFG